MIPRDDPFGGDDNEVDRLLRTAAAKADFIDWAISAEDVSGRPRPVLSRARHRSLAAGLLVAAIIVAIFVAPIPELNLFNHGSAPYLMSRSGPASALSCPRSRPVSSVNWVPSDAHGVEGMGRLVPEATPSNAVICAYGGRKLANLAGVTSVMEGLPALAGELTWLPRPEVGGCSGVGLRSVLQGKDPVPAAYLIGLSYPHGWLWVSTAYTGGCAGASNGTFQTSAIIGGVVKKAYETGRWVAPTASSCVSTGFGRLGQELTMVPGQPVSVAICYFKAGARLHQTMVSVSPEGLLQLRDLLNREPTFTSTNGCHQSVNPVFYTLIFSYGVGPPVVVSVAKGCVPAINNGSLQANDGTAAVALIQGYLQA